MAATLVEESAEFRIFRFLLTDGSLNAKATTTCSFNRKDSWTGQTVRTEMNTKRTSVATSSAAISFHRSSCSHGQYQSFSNSLGLWYQIRTTRRGGGLCKGERRAIDGESYN